MSIMDMFSSMMGSSKQQPQDQQQQQQQQQQPTPPGNIPPNAPTSGASGANAAPNGSLPSTPDTKTTPLDQFADLWKNEPTPEGQPQAGIFGEINPQKFMEAAGKIDFSKAVTPEILQSVQAGGEEGMKAFAAALNQVAQSAYAQSAFASTKITEQALARAEQKFIEQLPQLIKKTNVSDNLRKENPIFANPAVQPIISALETQLTVKFPQASASEITDMARKYVEALGSSFSPKPQETNAGEKDKMDWEAYLTT